MLPVFLSFAVRQIMLLLFDSFSFGDFASFRLCWAQIVFQMHIFFACCAATVASTVGSSHCTQSQFDAIRLVRLILVQVSVAKAMPPRCKHSEGIVESPFLAQVSDSVPNLFKFPTHVTTTRKRSAWTAKLWKRITAPTVLVVSVQQQQKKSR